MGTYNLPRNVKGEGRILFVFSTKALIYSAVGAGIGLIFYLIFKILSMSVVGLIFVALFALIGFVIDTNAFEITKKTGGENIDDVIKRAIKFKMQRNKIYVYEEENRTKDKEENKNE